MSKTKFYEEMISHDEKPLSDEEQLHNAIRFLIDSCNSFTSTGKITDELMRQMSLAAMLAMKLL